VRTKRDVVEARIEELIFALDIIENNENAKPLLMQKIDDLLEMIKE
jgi:hypothetical protein